MLDMASPSFRRRGMLVVIAASWAWLAAAVGVADDVPSFQYDVLAVLSKHGCSAGACHGSPTGKGGFRLSLRGFDPQLDALTLLREDYGRRTNPLQPEISLLLAKPLMRVPHAGGMKLRPGDLGFRILRDWVAAGCPLDSPDRPRCERIEVDPQRRELRHPESRQPLRVVAHFSDGSRRDITPLAVFSSSDDKVATVSDQGLIVACERGEATVLVRYLDFLATVDVTVLRDVPGFVWNAPHAANYVDELVYRQLRQLQIPPSDLCSDGEFLRRVTLDLLGRLPTVDETTAFLADTSSEKRRKLIDAWLERREYAEFWALKWADLLRVKGGKITAGGTHKFHRWLVAAMQSNMPYDQFARQLLTAEGSTLVNPPANFYRAATDVNDTAESVSQLFLGARIQCAKCHNHPYDRWSQDNYYGLGAFFPRVQRKTTSVPGEMIIWTSSTGDVTQPRTGQVVPPWVPDVGGKSLDELARPATLASSRDRRELLADWLTSPDNRLFAKVGANRIWAQVMGRGLVEPVDDFRDSNPPANRPLLDALADDFARHGYDQKHLLRTICNSRTYQLSSAANELNRADDKHCSHAVSRLLTAEQLVDAIDSVTGTSERFAGMPAGTRAVQLPNPDVPHELMKVFGQPGRNTVCDCERGHDPKLTQALQMISGEALGRKWRQRGSRLTQLLDAASAGAPVRGSPARDGLALWLRADEGATSLGGATSEDGDAIAEWQDQSGRGRTARQSDPNRRPVWVASSIGGRPALRFDGRDDFLNNTVDELVAPGAPRTVMIVARLNERDEGGAMFTFRRSTGGGKALFAAQHVTIGPQYYVYSDGVNAAGNSTLPRPGFDRLREPFVTMFSTAGAGAKLRVAVQGTEQPVSQPGAVGRDDGAVGFTIASREDLPAGDQLWGGDIAEILVYDRELTSEQLQQTGAYLAAKYGLATGYPALPPDAPIEPPSPSVAAIRRRSPPKSDRDLLSELYLAAYSRLPSDEEWLGAEAFLRESDDRRQAWEDLGWALLNSKEFLFQH